MPTNADVMDDKRRAKIKILAYLLQHRTGVTTAIRRQLDLHERSAQRYMRELLQDELIVMTERGYCGEPRWALTEQGNRALHR